MADWSRADTRRRLAEALLHHNGLVTVAVDETWTIVFVAGALEYVTGYTEPDQLVGRNLLELAHPDDVEIALAGIATAESLAPDHDRSEANIIGSPVNVRMLRADGRPAVITVAAANLLDDPALGVMALRVQLAEVQALIDRFVAGLATGGPPHEVLQPLVEAMTVAVPSVGVAIVVGHGDEVVAVHAGLDEGWMDVLVPALERPDGTLSGLSEKMDDTAVVDVDHVAPALRRRLREHGIRQVWAHNVATTDAPDVVCGCVVVLRSVDDDLQFNHRQELSRAAGFVSVSAHQWDQDRQLRHAAHHDPLTGLANRARFRQVLDDLDASGEPFALVYLDLDGFKEVNDDNGHDVGDAVLQAVADRLRACARDGDVVVRLGGDEFAVVAPGIATAEASVELCERIEAGLAPPVAVGGASLSVASSIGVARSGVEGVAGDVVRAADRAMYEAKRNRRAVPGPARRSDG